jgi:membrane fusion protein, copper/silver efflux system
MNSLSSVRFKQELSSFNRLLLEAISKILYSKLVIPALEPESRSEGFPRDRGSRSAMTTRFLRWVLITILSIAGLAACTHQGTPLEKDTYTCPMHPTVVSDKPTVCPVCGMDLVRKAGNGEELEITEDLAKLTKSTNEVALSSIKTIKGIYKKIPAIVHAQGVVTYDTRNQFTISTRVSGRIEKTYIQYEFQSVHKGQKIAEIYSPELITAQRELLDLVETVTGDTSLIKTAKDKLYLLGATTYQIRQLLTHKETANTFTIYSPYDGYVIKRNQSVPVITSTNTTSASMGGSEMESSSTQTRSTVPNTPSEWTRNGDYVTKGETLFSVVNPASLRLEFNLHATQASHLNVNDTLVIDTGNGNKTNASVDFIQPFFEQQEMFIKIRVYANTLSRLRIGQLTNTVIYLDTIEALWLPTDAVLDLGLEKIVFIKEHGVFKPRQVKTGINTNRLVEIKQGLSSSDEVAAMAHYLVDSESFIKSK